MLLLEYLKLTAPRISLMVMLTGCVGLWMGAGGKAEPSLVYILLLVFVSLMPYVLGMSGKMYLTATPFLGYLYILPGLAGLFLKKDLNRHFFYYSILYLAVCLISMSVDIQQKAGTGSLLSVPEEKLR
jgi:heme O synthase-like polyprenyltransferase